MYKTTVLLVMTSNAEIQIGWYSRKYCGWKITKRWQWGIGYVVPLILAASYSKHDMSCYLWLRITCCSRRFLGSICNTCWSLVLFLQSVLVLAVLHASCLTQNLLPKLLIRITVASLSDASHWIVFYLLANKAFVYFNDGFLQILVECWRCVQLTNMFENPIVMSYLAWCRGVWWKVEN